MDFPCGNSQIYVSTVIEYFLEETSLLGYQHFPLMLGRNFSSVFVLTKIIFVDFLSGTKAVIVLVI